MIFAHVSDLHFGHVLANRAAGRTPHQHPHDVVKCLALHPALAQARAEHGQQQHDRLRLVSSGDLTLSGGDDELAVGQLMLRSRSRIRRPRPGGLLGLGVGDDDLAQVPGNHDHWRGRRGASNFLKGVPAFNRLLHGNHFRATPWLKTWQDPQSGLSLQLFGVDSSSGLSHASASWRQRGSISPAELSALESLLAQPVAGGAPTLRAIICHHSLAYRGGLLGTAELEPYTRAELLRLAGRHGVSAILTGHTHDFHAHAHPSLSLSGQAVAVHELRCATTVTAGSALNGFLVHQLSQAANGGFSWQCWRYVWSAGRYARADAAGSPFYRFNI